MTLYEEIDVETVSGGLITAVNPGSLAALMGLQPSDELLAINKHPVQDVIDVQYYAAEEQLNFLVRREDKLLNIEAQRPYLEPLGLEFSHPTFDTDIRRCNNLCEFCFVLQMSPRFRRTLYIKDDDYRYSFLFGHYVTLTNLDDHDWWRIETMGLSPLYVSVHASDQTLRRRFLRNEDAPDIIEQLRWLSERHIEVHTQVVIVPEFNDGRHLEQSIRELEALRPTGTQRGGVLSVSVVPVGLTKHHKYGMRPHTASEAAEMVDFLDSLQAQYRSHIGTGFVYGTDEWYLVAGRDVPAMVDYDGHQLQENGLGSVRAFLDEWSEIREEIRAAPIKPRPHHLTLVTATLFAPVLRTTAAKMAQMTGSRLQVVPIVNERLGETITVAGLLMGSDILQQLESAELGDMIVLPRTVFDHPDTVSLDDITPQDIANKLGRPIVLADSLGDVWDALNGVAGLQFEPGVDPEDPIHLTVLDDSEHKSDAHGLS